MSRAFVDEDNRVEELPPRPVSSHPNYVTASGLAAINAALDAAQQAYSAAQAAADREALARESREVRYWHARRASAQLVTPDANADIVQFGSNVTLVRDDGRTEHFRIVGEDEANPTHGAISYVSPVAKALMGNKKGDVVRIGSGEVEILGID